jgi:DUF4097 and DUF4098 domain-containing protein YvlB
VKLIHSGMIMGAVLVMWAGPAAAKTYTFDYQKIIDTPERIELTLNNITGNVTVRAHDQNSLRIDAVKRINADSKEEATIIADHIQINVQETSGHFTIEPYYMRIHDRSPSFWEKLLGRSGDESYGRVDFEILVPVQCSPTLTNTSGDIGVFGIRGNVEISGTSGDVKINDVFGDCDIATTSGKIDLADIEGNMRINATGSDVSFYSLVGDVDFRNTSGNTSGEYVRGDVTMSQTTGNVRLEHIEGDVRVKSVSGAIRVQQEYGALDISTHSGDVAVRTELNSPKDYFVETVSGSIELLVPETAGGEVKLESSSGAIDTKVPIAIESFSRTRISGRFGTGGPLLHLATSSGDITLAEF